MRQVVMQSDNEVLFSRVINYLRFPLIVGVVFIHNASSTMIVQGAEMGVSDAPVYKIVSGLGSSVIGRLAVPLFFFISGYLFFYKVNFSQHVYGDKLKKRVKSLLVPYLFWNIALIAFYYIALHIPVISSWFRGVEYSWSYILQAMWGIPSQGNLTYPFSYQFWFIRDLMVMVLLTPAIYWLIKKTRLYGVIFLGIIWYLGFYLPYIGARGLSPVALFFFTFGAWFSVNNKDIIDIFDRVRGFAALYILVAVVDVCTKGEPYSEYIHRFGILLGVVFVFVLVADLLRKGRVRESAFLSSASFFVFALHERWVLSQVRKISFAVFKPESDAALILLYFGNVVVVIGVILAVYYVLRRFLPRFTALISGGR